LYASLGERDKAKEIYRQAADVFGALGNAQCQGETLLALGVHEWKTGNRSSALATYEAGLQTLPKLTAGRKTLRGLLGLRTRLLGGPR
jgi:tetratricopeptide (TPR) repeat protein